MAFTPQTPSNRPLSRRSDGDENELMVTLLTTFSSLYSGTTVSTLAIAGLVSRNSLLAYLAILDILWPSLRYLFSFCMQDH